jgi:hypothetical protein
MRREVLQVPIEGSSGKYSSGPLAFKNDWPGLWMRGDTCVYLKVELERLKQTCEEKGLVLPPILDEIIDCISDGVIVHKT